MNHRRVPYCALQLHDHQRAQAEPLACITARMVSVPFFRRRCCVLPFSSSSPRTPILRAPIAKTPRPGRGAPQKLIGAPPHKCSRGHLTAAGLSQRHTCIANIAELTERSFSKIITSACLVARRPPLAASTPPPAGPMNNPETAHMVRLACCIHAGRRSRLRWPVSEADSRQSPPGHGL